MKAERPWLTFVGQHLGLAVSALVFITLGLRVLAATRGDISSALALLQSSDPAEVLLGMGIRLLPWFPLLFALLAIARRDAESLGGSPTDRRRAVGFSVIAGGAALAAFGLLAPYGWGVLIAVFGGLVIALLGLAIGADRMPASLRKRQQARAAATRWERNANISRRVFFAFTLLVYLVLVLTPSMWLPREILSRDGGRTVVGFVLGSESETTAVLISSTREVVHLDTSSINRRQTCVLEHDSAPLLFRAFGDAADHPVCPD